MDTTKTKKQAKNCHRAEESVSDNAYIKQVHKDFYELFTTNHNKDMLKYAYQNPAVYDAVTQSPDYYLFRDEAQLIERHKEQLSEYLNDIKTVVEFGPGSENGLVQKTLPLLSYAQDLHKYVAADISKSYLEKIGGFIRSKTNIEVDLVEADFVEGSLKLVHSPEPKAYVMIGSTIGGFYTHDREKVLQNIYDEMRPGDIFFMTADTNFDSASLLKAYVNLEVHNIIKEIWKLYSSVNLEFAKVADQFTLKHIWNSESGDVEFIFTASKDLRFEINGFEKVEIKSGQAYNIGRSHKFKLDEIDVDFKRLKLNIITILKYNNMCLFVARK